MQETGVLTLSKPKASIAGFKAPRRVIFAEQSLPRTATGKLVKYRLVEQYSVAAAEAPPP
jgi:acyl-coenzyme A synthetase/AMP-(fatty) acid ligase